MLIGRQDVEEKSLRRIPDSPPKVVCRVYGLCACVENAALTLASATMGVREDFEESCDDDGE
jgi:hypothetical protein